MQELQEIQTAYVAENDTTMIYASDAPQQAECKFEFCHDSATNLTGDAEHENCDESNQTAIRTNPLQGDTPNRENGLTHSFIQTTDVPKPQEIFEMYENASRRLSAAQKRSLSHRAESVNLALVAQGHTKSMQQPHDDIVQGYLGHMRNWDWTENQNNQSDIAGSEESAEQSVEVVLQSNPSKSKNRNKNKGIVKDCALLEQCQGELSGSYEASDASMEKLVNQTQLLIDWYQQQTENGTSSEEKYEISDIVKFKIIEHYRKLWPWLNYRLAPKVEN